MQRPEEALNHLLNETLNLGRRRQSLVAINRCRVSKASMTFHSKNAFDYHKEKALDLGRKRRLPAAPQSMLHLGKKWTLSNTGRAP